MATQTDNLLLLDAVAPFGKRTLDSTDSLVIGVADTTFSNDVTVGGDATVDGNLTVKGTTTTTESETVLVADNHIYLNDGYETDAAQTGGLVINVDPEAATTESAAGAGFVAGIASTSNPTVGVASTANFAISDIVQVAGSTGNDGIYEVDALLTTPTRIQVRGVGTSATVEDFTQSQFVTEAAAGNITVVKIAVLRSGTDGIFESAFDDATPFTFSDFTTAAGTTLQVAYDNDPDGSDATITTNATDGAVVIAGNQKLQVTATNGLDVDTIADFDVTTFDVQMTGTNGFNLDGTAASNATVTAGNLTLSTITSGAVNITSADAATQTYPANDAAAVTITDGALSYAVVDSTTALEQLELPTFVAFGAEGAGRQYTASGAIALGAPVAVNATTATASEADADTGTLINGIVAGVAVAAATDTSPVQIVTVPGSVVPVLFGSAPASADIGKQVWNSATAGECSIAMPGPGGARVQFRVGYLESGDGADTTPLVRLSLDLVAHGPGAS